LPRIIITTAAGVGSDGFGPLPMLDELVNTDRLNDDHASLRLLERICWAIEDAEKQERDGAVRKERDEHRARLRDGGVLAQYLADEGQHRDRAAGVA
jgi:hypothetical protein